MLQVVRERQNSSVGKYWLERSIENYSVQSAALSLPDRIGNTTTIKVDGRDVELNSLPSDDPRYRAYRDELLFGGQVMSTQGYAKNQGIILQAQLQADEAQRKRYNTAQGIRVAGQISVDQRASAQGYIAARLTGDPDQAVQAAASRLQTDIDKIRLLPLTQEQQTDQVNKYMERWAAEVVVSARQQGRAISDMAAVLDPLRWVMTGPVDQRVKADGTANEALRLYNTLGGEAYFDQVVSKANAAQIQDNSQRAQMAGIQEQQAYDARLSAALPEGRRSDPAAIKNFFQAERERAAMEPDGVLRAARYSQLDASERQLTETYVKPVQEQRALWYAQQLGKTQNDEAARNRLAAQLQVDLNSGAISSTTATSIQTSLSAQGSKEVRSYDKDINARIDKLSKEWEVYSGSPNSYGGSTVADFESMALYKARDEARRRSQDTVQQAIKEGKDPVQALNQLWTNSNFGLRRREEAGGAQAPMYTNTSQLIQKNTGNWSRSTIAPRDANNLRGQSKVRPLMGPEPFATDVDAFLNGAPSQNFRTLLKTLTTGPGAQKPSEVILNQFRLMGIDVPEEQRQRIQAMDGQEISRVTPARRPGPQQSGALAGVQIAGRALGELLVPPAAAADLTSMMYASSTSTKPRTQPQPTVTPQARVDGYMKRLAYIETRIRNIPNAEGSPGRGYFQAFPDFSKEAIAASGGIDPRDPDYNRSAKAAAAWIRTYNKRAWAAIRAGRYDEADRLLRNTWPSLPGGDQAQDDKVQKTARKYLK
jgi:hypothetical protein